MPKITAATVAEHRERTHEALLDAVDALVLERGFEAISLRDIAAHAGVARTAIYNDAPDKTALLIAAAQRAAAPMRTAVADVAADQAMSPAARLEEIVRLLLVPLRLQHAEPPHGARHARLAEPGRTGPCAGALSG